MKHLNEILFITEEITDKTRWFISFRRPLFQDGESEEISQEDAYIIMKLLNKQDDPNYGEIRDDYHHIGVDIR